MNLRENRETAFAYPNHVDKEGIASGFCTSGLSCRLIMISFVYRMTLSDISALSDIVCIY